MQVALLEPAAAAAEGTKEMNRRETSGSIDRVKEMLQIEFHCPNRSGDPSHRFKKHYLKDLLEGMCTWCGDRIQITIDEMLALNDLQFEERVRVGSMMERRGQ